MTYSDNISLAFGALFLVSLIAQGVFTLRTKKRFWLGVLEIFISTILFLASGVGLHYVSNETDSMFDTLAKYKALPPLPSNWGDNFSAEDRTSFSLGMASSAYVQFGTFREYIDLTGSRKTFVPDENDKKNRQQYLGNLEAMKKAGDFAKFGVYGLFLLYLIGISLGFSDLWKRVNALSLTRKIASKST